MKYREIRESQEENNRKRQEETGEGNSKGKEKEKEVLDLSGDSSAKSLPNQTLENPEISKEERQDTSEVNSIVQHKETWKKIPKK